MNDIFDNMNDLPLVDIQEQARLIFNRDFLPKLIEAIYEASQTLADELHEAPTLADLLQCESQMIFQLRISKDWLGKNVIHYHFMRCLYEMDPEQEGFNLYKLDQILERKNRAIGKSRADYLGHILMNDKHVFLSDRGLAWIESQPMYSDDSD